MAGSAANYTVIDPTGKTIAAQWPDLHEFLGAYVNLLAAMVRTGTEPNDQLDGMAFGNLEWRVMISGADLLIQENTATAPTETWVTRNTFSATTGLTLATSAITSGTFADARIAASNVTQHVAAIVHDSLSGFVANEHIDHAGVSVTAGTGLSGGGTIAATRTINLADTAVTPGTYSGPDISLTVDQQGRLTAAAGSSHEETYDTNKAGTPADQAITTIEDIVFNNLDTASGKLFPGANSSKDYEVFVQLPYTHPAAGGTTTWKFHVGTTGDNTDPVVWQTQTEGFAAHVGTFRASHRVLAPGATDLITISATADAGTLTVYGGQAVATKFGHIRITKLP